MEIDRVNYLDINGSKIISPVPTDDIVLSAIEILSTVKFTRVPTDVSEEFTTPLPNVVDVRTEVELIL